MIKVKLSCPPQIWNFKKFFPNDNFIWGDYKFFLNQDISECDYWFIIGNIVNNVESVIVPTNNVIFNIQEVPDVIKYPRKFLNQFHYVSSYLEGVNHSNFIKSGPIFPWFIERDYNQSLNFQFSKSKKLSIISSNKKITIDHVKRFNFFKKLDKYFGDDIDIFGSGFSGFVDEKKETLDPYMFSIVVENKKLPNYFTEKVVDCFLAHTFPLYHGCSNFKEFFDKDSFETIDINNFDSSVNTIKKILDNDGFYESRIDSVIKSKHKYLNNFSIVPSIVNVINQIKDIQINNDFKKEKVSITKFKSQSIFTRLKNKIVVKAYDILN